MLRLITRKLVVFVACLAGCGTAIAADAAAGVPAAATWPAAPVEAGRSGIADGGELFDSLRQIYPDARWRWVGEGAYQGRVVEGDWGYELRVALRPGKAELAVTCLIGKQARDPREVPGDRALEIVDRYRAVGPLAIRHSGKPGEWEVDVELSLDARGLTAERLAEALRSFYPAVRDAYRLLGPAGD